MAKRRRTKKLVSRTSRSNTSDTGGALLGLAILSSIIAFIAMAVGVAVVLLPLILIPMWVVCKEWSRGIKMLISALVIIIWLLLLPFALGFLDDMLFESQDEQVATYSQSTILPTTTPFVTISPSPLPTSTPVVLPTLMKGMTDQHVVTLQNQLINLRYLEGNADGQFGSKTEQAVRLFQKQNGLVVNGIVDVDTASLLFSDNALAFEPLQEIILSIDKNTTQADVEAMIQTYSLPYTLQQFNSHWGQIMVYKIAYVEGATRHKHGITADNVEVKFSKKTGKVVYASYFNANAFYADYHRNYEVQIYFEEGWGGLLGYYGFNASSDGYDTSNREVPFDSVEEALDDVLKNASKYHSNTD